ncbi:MAG: hypothetical protein DI561_17060 [Thauera sp.]|nr:MAG: hypothetical protein DI561_17060 [Thauera sp.]
MTPAVATVSSRHCCAIDALPEPFAPPVPPPKPPRPPWPAHPERLAATSMTTGTLTFRRASIACLHGTAFMIVPFRLNIGRDRTGVVIDPSGCAPQAPCVSRGISRHSRRPEPWLSP